MTYRKVALVAGTVSIVYGVAALVTPDALASLYGITLEPVTRFAGQLLASSYLGYAIVNLLTRDIQDSSTQRAIAAANAFAWAGGFVLWGLAELAGITNAVGWSTVVVAFVFVVVWVWVALETRAAVALDQRATFAARR